MSSPQPTTTNQTLADAAPAPAAGGGWSTDAPLRLIWHALPAGQFDYVNADWCSYTGLDLARSCGDGWQQALHPDDLEHWQRTAEQTENEGRAYALRCRLARADSAYGWFLVRVEAIRGAEGQIAGWIGTATASADVPLPEQAATTALPLPPVAPAAAYGPSTFLAAAVHDLKNEMAVIRIAAQLLERRLRRMAIPQPESVLPSLTQIQRSTTKMHKLVEEFFDISRLQSGQPVEFNRQPTDLVALARGCLGEYAPTSDHVLTLSTTVETLIGDWDGVRLERVLANLLTNAIKYSAPASAIRVAIEREGDDNRALAVLTVQDEGVGIPAQDQPHIFAPYYRGSNAARLASGTGIGLYGSRAIVEQQGGELSLQSAEQRGTTVTMRLPLSP